MKIRIKKLIKQEWMANTKCKKYLCYPLRVSGKSKNNEEGC